jgi:hypothetical protein
LGAVQIGLSAWPVQSPWLVFRDLNSVFRQYDRAPFPHTSLHPFFQHLRAMSNSTNTTICVIQSNPDVDGIGVLSKRNSRAEK